MCKKVFQRDQKMRKIDMWRKVEHFVFGRKNTCDTINDFIKNIGRGLERKENQINNENTDNHERKMISEAFNYFYVLRFNA